MINLEALNSATKYPSIQTYHALGEKGSLTEEVTQFEGDVLVTEKVDGTNSRIIVMPTSFDGPGFFIGSREELLTAEGDYIHNPAMGIVDALREKAADITNRSVDAINSENIVTYYLETYGGKIGGAAKQYSKEGATGFRLFDISVIAPRRVEDGNKETLAAWRENGGQLFGEEPVLQRASERFDIPLTPRVATLPGKELPTTINATYAWMLELGIDTWVHLEEGSGHSEGYVLRSRDRKHIAKARFQDYERTFKRRK